MGLSENALEKKRAYSRDWREQNRQKIRDYHKNWRKENKNKIAEYNIRFWEKKAAEEE
jgi:hypothetical protein